MTDSFSMRLVPVAQDHHVGDITFRSAMQDRGIDLGSGWRRMTGPAAADYILASYPATA